MHQRVAQEIEMLKAAFPAVQYGAELDWVLIPQYALPPGRYNKTHVRLLFRIPPGYPNTGPDDFFVDNDLRLAGGNHALGFNPGAQSSSGIAPVTGDWGWFSWHPQTWKPAAEITKGDNLFTFLKSVDFCLVGQEQT